MRTARSALNSFLFALCVLLAGECASDAFALVGALPGDVSVDNKGAANYSIPLPVPPGRGGMVPKLGLAYNSNAGNGPLGLGWSISTGFPQSITRGRSILARDGNVRGIHFDSVDKLYLDGKRLVCVFGANGMPGSKYRTEIDSFVEIVATGTGDVVDTFVMTEKDGTKVTFGKTTGSSDAFHKAGGEPTGAAHTWAIKSVANPLGDAVEFFYDDLNHDGTPDPTSLGSGEHVLTAIRYTGNSRLLIDPVWELRFVYDINAIDSADGQSISRRDATNQYLRGRAITMTKHLDRVDVVDLTDSNSVKRRIRLAYEYSAIETNFDEAEGALVLKSVELTDGSNVAIVPATSFDYGVKSLRFGNPAAFQMVAVGDAVVSGTSYTKTLTGGCADYNRDGVVDLVERYQKSGGMGLRVFLSQPDGTHVATSVLYYQAGVIPEAWAADFNGDGFTDLVFFNYNGLAQGTHDGGWFVSLYVPGTGLAAPVRIIPELMPMVDGSAPRYRTYREGLSQVRDIDGDGLPDILTAQNDYFVSQVAKGMGANLNPFWFMTEIAYIQGPGFDDTFQSIFDELSDNDWPSPTPPDVASDLPLFYRNTTTSAPSVAFVGVTLDWSLSYGILGDGGNTELTVDAVELADFDGDGLTDAKVAGGGSVIEYPDSPGVSPITLTSVHGFGFNAGAWSFTPATRVEDEVFECEYPSAMPEKRMLVGDFNGDGAADLLRLAWRDPGQTNWTDAYYCSVPYEWITPGWMGWRIGLSKGTGDFDYDLGGGMAPTVTYGQTTLPTARFAPGSWYTNPEQAGRFVEYHPAVLDFFSTRDLDGDGADDLVFRTGENVYAVFTRNGHFDTGHVVKLLDSASYLPAEEGSPACSGGDFNGDGIDDLVFYQQFSGGQVAMSEFSPGPKLTKVINGLGKTTTIVYKSGIDPSVYTSGVPTSYPIAEIRNGRPVVADVFNDTGSDDADDVAQVSYQYSGNRVDLSGRGPLGFHSFVTLDRQTNIFKYQFLVQSFPMTGFAAREQTYRYWETGPAGTTEVHFRLVESHDNTVVFDEVSNGAGGALGTVFPFVSKAVEKRWENSDTPHFTWPKSTSSRPSADPEGLFPRVKPAGEHIAITVKSWFDDQPQNVDPPLSIPGAYSPSDVAASGQNSVTGLPSFASFEALIFDRHIRYGNLRRLSTDYGAGFSETVTTNYKSPADVAGLTGLVDSVETSVTSPDYGTEQAPTKRFTYWRSGAIQTTLVESDSIDADRNPDTTGYLDLTTTFGRDLRGRIESTTVSGYKNAGDIRHVGSYIESAVTAFSDRFDTPTTTTNTYLHPTVSVLDPLTAQATLVTDVNGAQIGTDYDGFGRVVQARDVLKGLATDSTYSWTSSSASDWTFACTVEPPSTVLDGIARTAVFAVRTKTTVQPATVSYFDRLGRTIRVVKEGFAGQSSTVDTIFDALGRTVAVSLPYAKNALPLWTITTYDKLGRVDTVGSPNGAVTTNAYFGRVTQATVSAVGRTPQTTTTLVDPKGRTIKVWNADNVPTGTIDLVVGPALTASVWYVLDGFGRMRATNLRGQLAQITASYDSLGQQASLNDPDKGLWTYVSNARGKLVQQTDAKNNVTETKFDLLGRKLARVTAEPNGPTETAKWFYFDVDDDTTRQTVAKGSRGWIGLLQREELTVASAPSYSAPATTAHLYNSAGLPEVELQQVDGLWFYSTTSYDSYWRPEVTWYYWRPEKHPAASDLPYLWRRYGVRRVYDGSATGSKSYVVSISDAADEAHVWWEAHSTSGYDHMDRVVLAKRGSGHWTKKQFRATDGMLVAQVAGNLSGTTVSPVVQDLAFDFDEMGNLTSRADNLRSLSETFGYDVLNRYSTKQDVAVVTYGDNGNILTKLDVTGNPSGSYSYTSSRPHAVTAAWGYEMTYDFNGNLETRTKSSTGEAWNTRWAGFDKPRWMAKLAGSTVRGVEFGYDAGRHQVVELDFDSLGGGMPAHYTRKTIFALGRNVEVEFSNSAPAGAAANWNVEKACVYIPAPDGPVGAVEFHPTATVDRMRRDLVYHLDHLGSIECVTAFGVSGLSFALDESGLEARFSFDPWGERRSPSTWVGVPTSTAHGGDGNVTRRGFTGHEMLDRLGLVHMGGRLYDPLIARFLSADLTVQSASDLQSFNRYSYVRNRPLSFTDPSGYLDETVALRYLSVTPEGRTIINDLQSGNVRVIEYTTFVERMQIKTVKAKADGSLETVRPQREVKKIWSSDSSQSTNPDAAVRGTITTDSETILIRSGMDTKSAVKRIRHEWEHLQQRKKDGMAAFRGKKAMEASETAAHVAEEKFADATNSAISALHERRKTQGGPRVGLSNLPTESQFRDSTKTVSESTAAKAIAGDETRNSTQTPTNERTSIFSSARDVEVGNRQILTKDVQGTEIKWDWAELKKWTDKIKP